MMWVLKKPSHWDGSFELQKYIETYSKEYIYNFMLKNFVYLNLCIHA